MIDLAKELQNVLAKQSVQYMAATREHGCDSRGLSFNLAHSRIG
jgi:hypothetical protein